MDRKRNKQTGLTQRFGRFCRRAALPVLAGTGFALAAGGAATILHAAPRPQDTEVDPGRGGAGAESCDDPPDAQAAALCRRHGREGEETALWLVFLCLTGVSAGMTAAAARDSGRKKEKKEKTADVDGIMALFTLVPASFLLLGVLQSPAETWLRPRGSLASYPLTEGEAALADAFFGGKVDTARVRLHFHDGALREDVCGHAAARACVFWDTSRISFMGTENAAADYSAQDSAGLSLFMHEMLHVYHNQNPDRMPKPCKTYDYALSPADSLRDFCTERQAALVEDYTASFLRGRQFLAHAGVLQDDPETRDLLQKIVEKEFPGARELRLARAALLNKKRPAP